MKQIRVDKINYYLDIAETVAKRATCIRKKYGAVIVNMDQIISTGYAGAPRGRKNCIDLGYCIKKQILPDSHHNGYDVCRSVHAEQNAIISAARKDMIGATLYLVGYKEEGKYEEGASPCLICRKMIINSGIEKVIVRIDKDKYEIIETEQWIEEDESLNGQTAY